MFNLSNLNPRIQTESNFNFNDSYNESRKYSLSSSEFDSLSQLSEVDLNNIKYVQIGQKNVAKNLNNVSDFATFRVNKTISNNNIVLNGVSKIQRVNKNYWTRFKGGEYNIEMQLIYTPILASSTINRQYRLDKSNSKLIIKELRPNIAERGSSPRLRDAVKLPYLSFITTNNVNGNHNNSSSGSSFTTSPSTPPRITNFVPENYRTTDFNTTKTIEDHLNDSMIANLNERKRREENNDYDDSEMELRLESERRYLKERFIGKISWNTSSRSSTLRSANTSTLINNLFANRKLTFEEIKKFKFFSFLYTGSENRKTLQYNDIGNLKLDRIHKEDKVIIKTFDTSATRFSESRARNTLTIPRNNNKTGYLGGSYNVDIKLVFDKQLDGTYLINTSETWFSIDTFNSQVVDLFGIILNSYESNSNSRNDKLAEDIDSWLNGGGL